MALTLKNIEAEYIAADNLIKAKDVTGLYDGTDNTGGWGAPNLARGDVTSAILTVTKGGEPFRQIDVTAEVVAAAGDNIDFSDITLDDGTQDGVYGFVLRVNGTYLSQPSRLFIHDILQAYASKFWQALACIDDIFLREDLKEECKEIELLLQGMQDLKERGREPEFNNTYRLLKLRIESNKQKFNIKL